jgi:SAM-dependent methyltransferase
MNYSETALQKVREDRLLIDAVDQWLYEEIAPYLGHRVLEIGCGLGNFARHLVDRDLYIGVETSSESVDYVNQLYRDRSNMKAYVADATSDNFVDLARFQIDTIFSLNVFEHIEDHATALRNSHAILQPGGKLILVVPAHMWLYGSIDRAIGHYRRYDKQMIAQLFQHVGLTCIAQKYINSLGALGWWVNSRLRNQETPPSGQLRLFNRIVPLVKWVERKLPPPFGISVLAIGEK